MSRRLTDAEKTARAEAREQARLERMRAHAAAQVATWPPIPEERLRRIAAVLDPPPLSDTA